MINTIEALRGLYVALGGDLTDVANITTIPVMLSAISEVAAAAASELPAVKGTDDGKVLSVVSGKWAKADLPKELPTVSGADDGNVLTVVSGAWAKAAPPTSEPFVVTFTLDANSDASVNKTFVEITAALNAGKQVLLNFVNNGTSYDFTTCNGIPLAFADSNYITFTATNIGDGSVKVYGFYIGSNNEPLILSESV